MGRWFIQHSDTHGEYEPLWCRTCKIESKQKVEIVSFYNVIDVECKSIETDYYIAHEICKGNIIRDINITSISIYPNNMNF